MLTCWHFGAGGDTLGKNMLFKQKMQKTGITLQNNRDPSVGRNFVSLTCKRILNKTCDVIINETYLQY